VLVDVTVEDSVGWFFPDEEVGRASEGQCFLVPGKAALVEPDGGETGRALKGEAALIQEGRGEKGGCCDRVEKEGEDYYTRVEREAGKLQVDAMTKRGLGMSDYREVMSQNSAVLSEIKRILERAVSRITNEGMLTVAGD